uniref:IGF-like family receptor 1 n=1 Tax=Poecilia latipinna TaxID=48699 RepID=A0A3B3V5M0_9TELE
MMGYSNNCRNLTTFWDKSTNRCEPCEKKAGSEVQPNCGRDDEDGYHSNSHKDCKPNTFNDGSQYYCQECSACPPGTLVVKNCTSVSDTIFSKSHFLLPKCDFKFSLFFFQGTVPIIVILLIIFLVAALCALMMKKRRVTIEHLDGLLGTPTQQERTYHSNSLPIPSGFFFFFFFVDADILSAPLHKVLDDLDVLEELVILLDPDTQGIKSTKHLASHCSFPSTWITYTYSMKDTKSPLKAVLEGVTSKQPDWTVGHLAKLLRQMNRNDAISVLAKLRPTPKSFT